MVRWSASGSLPVTGNKRSARSAKVKIKSESTVLTLEKYQPKTIAKVRTQYGNAAIGGCSQAGNPCGRKNPRATKKISPLGMRNENMIFDRFCVIKPAGFQIQRQRR